PSSFNAAEVKSLPGMRAVIEIPSVHMTHQFGDTSGPGSRNYTCSGVAVVADSTWAALQARKKLKGQGAGTHGTDGSTAPVRKKMRQLTSQSAALIRDDGDFAKAHAAAARRIEATYEVPFLAHATMEPVNCIASVSADTCEIWAPTQIPGAAADSVAAA